jgi:hypothetical protein
VGYLEAQIAYARKRPELWRELQESVQALVQPDAATTPAAPRGCSRTTLVSHR